MADPIPFRRRRTEQELVVRAAVTPTSSYVAAGQVLGRPAINVTMTKDSRTRRFHIRPGSPNGLWFCRCGTTVSNTAARR
jgi:hypothetical protein